MKTTNNRCKNIKMKKKLFVETLGCAMNVRDSEHLIAELSAKEDYALCDRADDADLILINTCSVREKPVHKLFSELGAFNKIKKAEARIGVCGCTASHLGDQIIKKAPYVDFVLGARNVSKITDVLHHKHAVATEIDYDESLYAFGEYRSSPFKALINISIGCDKQCTFCIVPHTRGEEISIPADLIVSEAQRAAAGGAREIFLLGQNVNNYGRRFSGAHEPIDFTELLRRVSAVEEVERIRFTSPHPLHMDDAFIAEFAINPKICKSIHVPLQSGSTRLLKAMKRGYTREWFLDRIERLRTLVPDVHISTDVIVAFPGETDEDYEQTLEVVQASGFEQMFSFKYSPRPHTAAAQFPEQIDPEVGSARLSRLQKMHNAMLDAKCERYLGRTYRVYFEELREHGFVAGRSDNNLLIKVKGSEELLGQFVDVKITQTARLVQIGEPL